MWWRLVTLGWYYRGQFLFPNCVLACDLCTNDDIILNPKKFVFRADTVEFSGYTQFSSFKQKHPPNNNRLPRQQPINLTDVRLWFGLVNLFKLSAWTLSSNRFTAQGDLNLEQWVQTNIWDKTTHHSRNIWRRSDIWHVLAHLTSRRLVEVWIRILALSVFQKHIAPAPKLNSSVATLGGELHWLVVALLIQLSHAKPLSRVKHWP